MHDSKHGPSLKLESFSEHGLDSQLLSQYIPESLIIPVMTPAQRAAFDESLVVFCVPHSASDPPAPATCEYQALDNLGAYNRRSAALTSNMIQTSMYR